MERRLEVNQLFVSGMPQDCSEQEMLEFFSLFGKIDNVKPWKTGYSRSKSFLVTPGDDEVYLKILGAQNLVYRKRLLHCKPFCSKKSNLKNQILDANIRRVLLKKVPSQISEEEIKTLIEGLAGEIEMMFAYRPETSDQEHFHLFRKFRTYSVLFRSPIAAEKLLRLGKITLDKQTLQPIKIEKFIFRGRKGQGFKETPSPQSFAHIQAKINRCPTQNFRDNIELGMSQASRKGPYKDYSPKYHKNTAASESSSCQVVKYLRVDINANMHAMRPSSKKYFTYHTKFLLQPESGLQIRLVAKRTMTPQRSPT